MRAVLAMLLLLTGEAGAAERVIHARIDRDVLEYQVHPDLTYTGRQVTERTLFTRRALQALDRETYTFDPARTRVAVAEAWVDQPDGSRVMVAPGSIFTRPSAQAQAAPGFLSTVTMSVLFPQLREGSRTHVVWTSERIAPQRLGLSLSYQGWFDWDADVQEMHIDLPADLPFRWAARDVTVSDTADAGVRHIVARLAPSAGQDAEPGMANGRDFLPLFLATSLAGPEEIGARVAEGWAGRAAVTPEIARLAAQIAGERTGREAARAIHAWVTGTIRGIAVPLNINSDYLPRAAAIVLASGFGDSRDAAVLMQALLAARGIAAVPAFTEVSTRQTDLPLFTAFAIDHALLYLPAFDVFVDPSERFMPFGALGRRIAGKLAVLVQAPGAVMRIPAASADSETARYDATLTLASDGTIRGAAQMAFSPAAEAGVRRALSGALSLSAMAADTLSATPEGGLGGYGSSDPRNLLEPLQLAGSWTSEAAVDMRGTEVFLRVPQGMDLFPASSLRGRVGAPGARRTPALGDATTYSWRDRIALPIGWRAMRLPPDVAVHTAAGDYSARYRAEEAAVSVERRLAITANLVPADAYAALRAVLAAALVDARAVVVLGAATP